MHLVKKISIIPSVCISLETTPFCYASDTHFNVGEIASVMSQPSLTLHASQEESNPCEVNTSSTENNFSASVEATHSLTDYLKVGSVIYGPVLISTGAGYLICIAAAISPPTAIAVALSSSMIANSLYWLKYAYDVGSYSTKNIEITKKYSDAAEGMIQNYKQLESELNTQKETSGEYDYDTFWNFISQKQKIDFLFTDLFAEQVNWLGESPSKNKWWSGIL